MLTRRERHNQVVYQKFLSRWSNEYLKMLRQNGQRSPPDNVPETGDIVLIHDDLPRIRWQLGKITSTFIGRDGHIRVAEVKTKSGTITRPIAKLYPLEIRQRSDIGVRIVETEPLYGTEATPMRTTGTSGIAPPPARVAAWRARGVIQDQYAAGSV